MGENNIYDLPLLSYSEFLESYVEIRGLRDACVHKLPNFQIGIRLVAARVFSKTCKVFIFRAEVLRPFKY